MSERRFSAHTLPLGSPALSELPEHPSEPPEHPSELASTSLDIVAPDTVLEAQLQDATEQAPTESTTEHADQRVGLQATQGAAGLAQLATGMTIPDWGANDQTSKDGQALLEQVRGIKLSPNELEGRTLKECYYVERKLGSGGMAWVYRALHTAFQAPVALKFLFAELADEAEVYDRFLTEAKLQFTLKHPHIVHVTDIIDEWGLVGCVMEWVDGTDLGSWLKEQEGPLSLGQTWRLFGPVIEAIGFAHSKEVVHRDIKPSNILLHVEGARITPKVADFGIAKRLNQEPTPLNVEPDMPMGSLQTIAPEQIGNRQEVDHRADIYSLGVVLYRLTTGRMPFEGEGHELIVKHLREEPLAPRTHNPALPEAVEAVILKALHKDREQRFASCEAMYDALYQAAQQALAAGAPIEMPSVSLASLAPEDARPPYGETSANDGPDEVLDLSFRVGLGIHWGVWVVACLLLGVLIAFSWR